MALRDPEPKEILIVGWLLIGIAAALILARLHLRIRTRARRLVLSDVAMCLAWVFGVTSMSFNVSLANLGALDQDVKITLDGYRGSVTNVSKILKLYWVWALMFLTCLYLSKAALLALYAQIFPIFMVKRRMFLWATIVMVSVAYLASVLTHIFICLPVSRVWNINPSVTCPSSKLRIVFQVGWFLHLATDILIFILPWLIIPELKLKTSLRLGVYFTFLLGLGNIAISITRYVCIESAVNQKDVEISVIMLFNTLDCNTALIIACLPALRPFFGRNRTEQQKESTNSGDPLTPTETIVRDKKTDKMRLFSPVSYSKMQRARRKSSTIGPYNDSWHEERVKPKDPPLRRVSDASAAVIIEEPEV